MDAMEQQQRGYGYGSPPALLGSHEPTSAGAAGAPKPKGWSSLTRLHRCGGSPARDPFPPLPSASNTNSLKKNGPLQVAPANSERSIQQCGVSPSSSTGSFSSNHSGRSNWGVAADAQAAFSTNNAVAANGSAVGSPPESSSGSFAPNGFGSDIQSIGSRTNPASSAGSLSLTPTHFLVQSGVFHSGTSHHQAPNGRQRHRRVSVTADGDGQQQQQESAAARRVEGVDAERRGANFSAERNELESEKPAVSDRRSSIGNAEQDLSGAHRPEQGRGDYGDSTAATSAFHVPVEPEWEEEDMYLRIRSDALKETRARDRLARGASQAYSRGDHRKAKVMSKQAQEKRMIAEKLHTEAAQEILSQRNRNSLHTDIWHLDLHGLHGSEAIGAVERRLALLEGGLAGDQWAGGLSPAARLENPRRDPGLDLQTTEAELSFQADHAQEEDHNKHRLFQSLVSASKLLSVVTGVGAHSQGGPTLPSVVKSFLITNGYQVEEPRPGVICVRPKLRFAV